MMYKFLILQLLAHVVSDFFLQTEKSCKSKVDNAFKSRHLYIHTFITFVVAWLFSLTAGYWWSAMLIAISHFVIDGLKSIFKKTRGIFFIDQLLHLSVIIAAVILYNNKVGVIMLPNWLPETKVWLWALAFVFCLRPANFFIQNVFKDAKISVPNAENDNLTLPNAGHVIGNVERTLTLVFVMLCQYQAIGFLMAAKSLLRFKETDTVKSEYVLVGTLLSFATAVLSGVLVKYILKYNV